MKNKIPLTKTNLQNALKQERIQLTKFLEKYVLEPTFGLKKDVSVIKNDVREVKHEISNINRRIDASFNRTDRHADQLADHEKRITKIERIPPAVAS